MAQAGLSRSPPPSACGGGWITGARSPGTQTSPPTLPSSPCPARLSLLSAPAFLCSRPVLTSRRHGGCQAHPGCGVPQSLRALPLSGRAPAAAGIFLLGRRERSPQTCPSACRPRPPPSDRPFPASPRASLAPRVRLRVLSPSRFICDDSLQPPRPPRAASLKAVLALSLCAKLCIRLCVSRAP